MKQEKGQVANEYLIIATFVLIAVAISFSYSLQTLQDTGKLNQVITSSKALAKAADQVSALGPGNTVLVKIELPAGVESGRAENKVVNFVLTISSGENDIFSLSQSNLTPINLPTSQGVHTIKVELVDANVTFSEVA